MPRTQYAWCRRGLAIYCCSLLLVSCSNGEKKADDVPKVSSKTAGETTLDVHFILGSKPEELIARFGEPVQYRPEPENGGDFGFLRWKDIHKVRVFAVIKGGSCAYVNYDFDAFDSFDETEAFELIGIEPPEDEPTVSVPKTGVKKWYPFEQYDRLTVSAETKRVGVRVFPFETWF